MTEMEPEGATPERFPSPPCIDPECEKPRSWQRGLCKDHYRAHRKAGTLEDIALAPSSKVRRKVGDRWLDYAGYVMTYADQGVEPEHRYVMRKALGRPLVKGENVHHINGNRADNRVENLELWFSPQPAGQRVEQLIPYVAENHPEAVMALIRRTESAPERPEAPEAVPTDQGAREALVGRLAEAIRRAFLDMRQSPRYPMPIARAALPLVEAHAAAQVEAAVSVVRAEREDDVRVLTLQHSTALSGYEGMRDRAESSEADLRALREKVARVEALLADKSRHLVRWIDDSHLVDVDDLRAALSDPTTPDQTGGDAPPSIADTCCGKCPGDTCYVDGVTGA